MQRAWALRVSGAEGAGGAGGRGLGGREGRGKGEHKRVGALQGAHTGAGCVAVGRSIGRAAFHSLWVWV